MELHLFSAELFPSNGHVGCSPAYPGAGAEMALIQAIPNGAGSYSCLFPTAGPLKGRVQSSPKCFNLSTEPVHAILSSHIVGAVSRVRKLHIPDKHKTIKSGIRSNNY